MLQWARRGIACRHCVAIMSCLLMPKGSYRELNSISNIIDTARTTKKLASRDGDHAVRLGRDPKIFGFEGV